MKRISLLNPIKTIINTVKGLFHEAPRKAVDYSRAENWAFLADTTGAKAENPPADVFFISPTACLGRYEPYFLDLSNQKEKTALAKVIRMEKGIYDRNSRFFAPYYRQAGFEVYSFGEDFREECLRDAHQDVEDAFQYYMEHYNDGRPLIIAGFSQGADHVLRLLKAHATDARVTGRLIAAYAIGWTITAEEMAKYPQLHFAGRADDTGVIVAFKNYNIVKGIIHSPWAGLKYFRKFIADPYFWKVVRNTLSITIGRMVFGFPAPILLALLLNELVYPRFKRVVQSVSYMPHFVSWIVVAYLLESLLAPTGLFNQVNRLMGRAPVFYMGRSDLFSGIVIISGIWKDIGWNTIVYLAALSGVDPQLYEAARVEGASKWQQTRFITLPCIMPTIVLLLTLAMPGLIQAGTDQIYPLMNTANMGVAEVIDIYVLRNGLQQGYYGMSTALGLVSSTLSLLLVLGTNRIAHMLNGEGLW